MSDDFDFATGMPSAEMAQYLQMYLDETSEQLDALVESLLLLESNPTDAGQLNESFRLIHSIKGSSAMMGLDGITALTHHLENHFERLRSGLRELDQASMALILRAIDFLRGCNVRLRVGEALGSAPELLGELSLLSSGAGPSEGPADDNPLAVEHAGAPESLEAPSPPATTPEASVPSAAVTTNFRVLVQFEAQLSLADLKAELVLRRLSEIATVEDTRPARSQLESVADTRWLEVLLSAGRSSAEVRAAADVDGVELVEIDEGATTFVMPDTAPALPPEAAPPASERTVDLVGLSVPQETGGLGESPPRPDPEPSPVEAGEGNKSKVVETVRVDIARLDKLMNLTGELVVNKARFVEIARRMAPAFKKSTISGRVRALGESMRRAIQLLEAQAGNGDDESGLKWREQLHDVESELSVLETMWEESRRGFGQITEAIDQMARVSDSLQRGVLDTRMVPIAPLFNRFKRVVRDIALELDKKVQLEIEGEKTELDKRMIDELGDPLIHLVRNAIDHGIEPAEVRVRRGKSPIGTIRLEASHSGNTVYIAVRDDGGGINIDKVRERIVQRGLLTQDAAQGLSEGEVIEYIWHPGFSTADAVSDISGRGVGMDIVKTRIAELNGTVGIQHVAAQGTTFTVRLPLTLAIIRSLLFRVRQGIFAVPMDNVREIVSVNVDQVLAVHGRETFDVRGKFVPLVGIDDIFDWRCGNHANPPGAAAGDQPATKRIDVVILHSADRTMGLKVDELHGGQEIVIKSLAENFVPIRGLSGASILGDGTVCLLLDTAAAINMVTEPRRQRRSPLAKLAPAV
ncbi:MAG TPA: chemotaxis protein CheW [Pirellulales bacterium]|nr:chemotaxis protein CheW [Pirellulales bacterium]